MGRTAYELAGGSFTYDLFSDEGFVSDGILLETLAVNKLTELASSVSQNEGWKWSLGRISEVNHWGADADIYSLLSQPEYTHTGEDAERIDVLENNVCMIEEKLEELDDDAVEREALEDQAKSHELEMLEILERAEVAAWSDDIRQKAGVVVHLERGEFKIQRGVMLCSDEVTEEPETQPREETETDKPLSAVLTRSLSSERTFAVQAALAQRPKIALALFVHDSAKAKFTNELWFIKYFQVTQQNNASFLHTKVIPPKKQCVHK